MIEIRRTETSKTFDLGKDVNGRQRYALDVYIGAIHYKDASGSWQDIDTNFAEADSGDYALKFTKLSYLARIANDSGRRIYPDRNDLSYWINVGKPFPSMGAPVRSGNTFTWDFLNATLKVTFANTRAKFQAVLKNGAAPTSLTIPFNVEGITRQGRELYHNGKLVAVLTKPFAVDANGVKRDVDVTFQAGSITLSLDTAGLTYPIDVDPTLDVQPSAKDTLMEQANPTTNYGSSTALQIRDTVSSVIRSILEFDISALPAGATLDVATLSLYYYYRSGVIEDRTVLAAKLTRTDWVEAQATWNIYKTANNWTSAGGDFVTSNPAAGSTTIPGSANAWMAWGVLAIIQDAYDASNAAEFLIKFETETTVGGLLIAGFYSSNYTDDTSLRPKIHIEYTVAAFIPKIFM